MQNISSKNNHLSVAQSLKAKLDLDSPNVLLTINEVCYLTGYTRKGLRELSIPYCRSGKRSVRYSLKEIQQWLKSHTVQF